MDNLIVNDVLLVVCAYTTPGITLKLLTSFVPTEVYKENVWRIKTIVESRGLVVDDDVIDRVRGIKAGKWYAYYLAQNRTFCGDVFEVKGVTKLPARPKTTTKMRDVIYYEVAYTAYHSKTTIVQHRDLTVKISKKNFKNMTSKIRQVIQMRVLVLSKVDISYNTSTDMLAILDEYGDVWLYNPFTSTPDKRMLDRLVVGEGIVGINIHQQERYKHKVISDQPLLLLNRNGQVRYLNEDEWLESPKVVSLSGIKLQHEDIAMRHDGKPIRITPDPYRWDTRAQVFGWKIMDDVRFLNGHITTSLKPLMNNHVSGNMDIIQYSPSNGVFMTTDRSARYDDNIPLQDSLYRTQSVTLDPNFVESEYNPAYIIVDAN